jgi:hypothetical protein
MGIQALPMVGGVGVSFHEKITRSGLPTRFQVRRAIVKLEPSSLLAEFLEIMFGDGGVGPHQITIPLNAITNSDYADFVVSVIHKMFGLAPFRQIRNNACKIVVSSVDLIDFLYPNGLIQGNKVTHHVTLPLWIYENSDFVNACLRGLIDTDGSISRTSHCVAGRRYEHACLCFRNYSQPLLYNCLPHPA